MSRERVEDLGRLLVLLDNLAEHQVFDNIPMGAKRFQEWFFSRSEQEKGDIIHSIGYGLQSLKEGILGCWEIAVGDDDLNTREDGRYVEK